MELKRAKGTRDFSYEEELLNQDILKELVAVFQLYGYNPIDTPILELYETLASKYGGGAEILKETFKLKDQGGRELALRYDLTVPLARYIAMNPQLKMPVKRYQTGRVFRDGPIKLGRYREFWQCDVDAVGIKGMEADAEMITLAQRVFKRLKLNVVVKINNRKILDALMEYAKIPKEKQLDVILSVDKLEKIGMEGVRDELKTKGIKEAAIQQLFEILLAAGTSKDKLVMLWKVLGERQGLNEIEKVLSYAGGDVEFDPSLARGLSYYTGTVYEVYLKDKSLTSSLAAGGRYDRMICAFMEKDGYEAAGISFGLDVITDALKMKGWKTRKSVCQVYVIPIKQYKAGLEIAEELRKNNISCDVDMMERGISKNLDYASKMEIPYVVFVGEKELSLKKVKLRNMISGKEELMSVKDIIGKIAS